jgi:hypothetical protein
MDPSKRDKGKGKSDEGSSALDPLNLGRLVDIPREKKLLLNFRNHSLILQSMVIYKLFHLINIKIMVLVI